MTEGWSHKPQWDPLRPVGTDSQCSSMRALPIVGLACLWGPSRHAQDTQLTTTLPALLPAGRPLHTGPDGDAALHLACLYGNKPCVEALIAAGCKLDPINRDDGTSPLHDAAAGGYLGIAQLLLDKAGPAMVTMQVRCRRDAGWA